MKIKSMVEKEITGIEPGKIFTYSDLPVYSNSPATTIKAVGRLVQNGELRRFSKGQFYRPKPGMFGEMQLSDDEKLKSFLFRNGKRTGYITGTSLYNRLGLTTQNPGTITIAGDRSPQRKNLGTVVVQLIKAKMPVSESNREMLEMLDVITDLKNLPDSEPAFALRILESRLGEFSTDKIEKLVSIAGHYPPAARAVLGMMLSNRSSMMTDSLKKGLNPLTRYKIGLNGLWTNAKDWNVE